MASNDAEDRTNPAIAMVATSSKRLPDVAAIVKAATMKPRGGGGGVGGLLGSLFGKKKPAAAEAAEPPTCKDGHLVMECGGGHLAVSMMPAPIPWSDLEGPCATSWWWPEATERMRGHTYHVLVALIGGSFEPVERRVVLTRVVDAVVASTDAVGVYWAEGTVVHEPAMFREQARDVAADGIPGPLWIDVRVEENPDGTLRCFTTGMAPLGFLEIEVQESRLQPQELLEFIGDTCCYIVNGRKHINDGETMGRTAQERYKVRHTKSMFDRGKVMRLVMT